MSFSHRWIRKSHALLEAPRRIIRPELEKYYASYLEWCTFHSDPDWRYESLFYGRRGRESMHFMRGWDSFFLPVQDKQKFLQENRVLCCPVGNVTLILICRRWILFKVESEEMRFGPTKPYVYTLINRVCSTCFYGIFIINFFS